MKECSAQAREALDDRGRVDGLNFELWAGIFRVQGQQIL